MRPSFLAAALGALFLCTGGGVGATEMDTCLPPLPGEMDTEAECRAVLGHNPPPKLRQDVHVADCIFAQEVRSGWLMSCSVTNNSAETIDSISYVVRYFEHAEVVAVAESGFGEDHILGAGSLNLASGATARAPLLGPALPDHIDASLVVPRVEITDVRVPGSPVLR